MYGEGLPPFRDGTADPVCLAVGDAAPAVDDGWMPVDAANPSPLTDLGPRIRPQPVHTRATQLTWPNPGNPQGAQDR